MSYSDAAALAKEPAFGDRLGACLCSEAAGIDDELATTILRSPTYGVQLFMPLVSSAPGFADAFDEGGQESIDDGMILSAVQASWARVATLLAPPG